MYAELEENRINDVNNDVRKCLYVVDFRVNLILTILLTCYPVFRNYH